LRGRERSFLLGGKTSISVVMDTFYGPLGKIDRVQGFGMEQGSLKRIGNVVFEREAGNSQKSVKVERSQDGAAAGKREAREDSKRGRRI
jgi:hypothetical protein